MSIQKLVLSALTIGLLAFSRTAYAEGEDLWDGEDPADELILIDPDVLRERLDAHLYDIQDDKRALKKSIVALKLLKKDLAKISVNLKRLGSEDSDPLAIIVVCQEALESYRAALEESTPQREIPRREIENELRQ